jgi:hypothetical protein
MSLLALLLMLAGPPDLARLGDDDFATREAEEQRCDCLLRALLLPASHADAETDFRVKRVRRRRLKWLRPEYVERCVQRADYRAWLAGWFVPGRSALPLEEVFDGLQREGDWRVALGERWGYWHGGAWALDDLPTFRDYCDYHRMIAPLPREVPVR